MTARSAQVDIEMIFKVEAEDGRRFVIYHASVLGNPSDHDRDKWYFRPYPVPVGFDPSEPFDRAEDAERAARASQP